MAKFQMQEMIPVDAITARLGAGSGSANWIDSKEVGKPVKLIAESQFGLCAAGDRIEGFIIAVEASTADNFSIGSVTSEDRRSVTFDGLQATPGVGVVAVGDYVVAGTAVAKGTALSVPPKVGKATNQPGVAITVADNLQATINAALVKVADAQLNSEYAWRVVSLGSAGTGAVGTTGVIERIG